MKRVRFNSSLNCLDARAFSPSLYALAEHDGHNDSSEISSEVAGGLEITGGLDGVVSSSPDLFSHHKRRLMDGRRITADRGGLASESSIGERG